MSQENVDHIRRAFAAFAEEGTEAVIPFLTTDIRHLLDRPNGLTTLSTTGTRVSEGRRPMGRQLR